MIDTAPMGVVSDAFPLLRKVDGAIAVTRIGMCTRDSAAHLREQLAGPWRRARKGPARA